jgi:Holliday junction resolvase-like predicted endonuclease
MPDFSEADLAKKVVAWLREQEWKIYQEVEGGGGVADIVATRGPLVWVIECKKTLGLSVLSQAYKWRYHAHFVSIAVPMTKKRWLEQSAEVFMRDYGIGCLRVDVKGQYYRDVEVAEDPKLFRTRYAKKLRESLCEEHRTFAQAGTNRGGHWTPFKRTCGYLVDMVTRPGNNGMLLHEAIKKLEHHYVSDKSAVASLKHLIEKGGVKALEGFRLEREGRYLKLFWERKKEDDK